MIWALLVTPVRLLWRVPHNLLLSKKLVSSKGTLLYAHPVLMLLVVRKLTVLPAYKAVLSELELLAQTVLPAHKAVLLSELELLAQSEAR